MPTNTEEILHRHKKTGARVRIVSEWDEGDWFMVEDQDGRLYTAYKTSYYLMNRPRKRSKLFR